MKFASATHVGRVRQENEDYLIAKRPVFIVADGMGGHNAGEVASKLAADTALKVISSADGEDKLSTLKKAVEEANRKVIEKAYKIQAQNGMGTTFTGAYIDGLTAYFAHIGDSRAYLLRGSKLKQLTEDHSLVAEMVKQGKITNTEASQHPYRNVITRAIGSDPNLQVDLFSYSLRPGDRLLITSDGLTGLVKDNEIKKLMANEKAKTACDQLVKAANNKGGPDNISVILVEIEENESRQKLKIKSKKMSKFRMWWLILGAAIVLLTAMSLYYANANSYYLTTYKGKVALYQGLPYKVLGFKLSKATFVSDVSTKNLDSAMKKRLAKKILIKDRAGGLQAIKDIGESFD